MQNPGGNFEALREAPANNPTFRVALDLNNYALASSGAAASASSTFSADWPASAVINGDETHINAGSASVAENGIGRGVWQGNVVSGGGGVLGTPEVLLINFPAPVRINRLRLIFWPAGTKRNNLGAIAPKDYTIEISAGTTLGYGEGGFGEGGFGGVDYIPWEGLVDKGAEVGKGPTTISLGVVAGNTEDMNVFEDPQVQTVQFIRITFTKLQSAGVRTRVVEVEVTRSIDITDDVVGFTRSRRKDYKLNRRLASEANLTLINFSRKYSPSHVPNSDEIAAGYFNSELRPNLVLRMFSGFSGNNVQIFTGYIDRFDIDGLNRVVKIKARDAFKQFIDKPVTTTFKSNQSVEALTELLGNLANFPSNLMILDTTTVNIPFFAPKDDRILDQMQKLGDATGDSEQFVDEFGRLNYRSYLNVISHIFVISGAADFQSGTNNNTDSTTTPGQILLAKVAGNYVTEGTWDSPLSPVLSGKVEFINFSTVQTTGSATSINWYIRVTNDGGATFTPYRPILGPGPSIMSKWNHGYSQVQVRAVLRSSNVAQTPTVSSITIRYKSRGGSQKISPTAQFSLLYNSTMLGLNQVLTDEVGGANYMITKATVKSTPKFPSLGSTDAWIASNNGQEITASNPLFVPVGTTTFNVDFGSTAYDAPQTVVMTLGTAVATAALTTHPTKPVLTITATVAGTITLLKITGKPFITLGTVEAVNFASQLTLDTYGEREEVFENEYIDNVDLASDIGKSMINQFGMPLTWLPDVPMRFSPNLQINDRGTVVETNSDLNTDFYVIGISDSVAASAAAQVTAETKLELVKITSGNTAPNPAFFGSAGIFYYDNFKFGGNRSLQA